VTAPRAAPQAAVGAFSHFHAVCAVCAEGLMGAWAAALPDDAGSLGSSSISVPLPLTSQVLLEVTHAACVATGRPSPTPH
jgi:hypothetical protein